MMAEIPPAPHTTPDEPEPMSLGDHLDELRGCLGRILLFIAVCAAIAGIFYQQIFDAITWPMNRAFELADVPPDDAKLYSGLMDTFMSLVKAVVVVAGAIATPLILREAWKFVRPGLHDSEIKAVRPLFWLGAVFFMAGVAMAFGFIAPLGQAWFLGINQATGVESLIRVNESIDFTVLLMLVFGLAFETPLVIAGLIRGGVVEAQTLRDIRRYVIFAAFVLGAVFTPPDVITQISLAAVLIVLYEIGIILGGKRQNPDPTNNLNP